MRSEIPDFSQAQIIVLGDVMLDRYWHGSSTRISPEAPVPVVNIEDCEERPGGAANVAVNIASLGGRVCVLGLTGDDEAAAKLTERLNGQGVANDFVRLPGQSTITKLRVLSRHQQLLRLDFEDGFPNLDAAQLLTRLQVHLADSQLLVLSDYGKGALRNMQDYIKTARNTGLPVLIDPKGRDFSRYRGATLITPNFAEFQAVVGPCQNSAELAAKGNRLLQELALDALLITRSEQGMSLLQKNGEVLHLPTQARDVYDVTGAGDTVIAVLAASVAAGMTLPDATALANRAAGIVVGKLGTANVTAAELRASESADPPSIMLNESDLLQAIAAARAEGGRIVMTNGCFDILHSGHVTYLQQARQLGERLIVAVNDDDSVRRLKGSERPVNTLADRMLVLAALAAVDWVIPFYEDTPERLICRLKPDFLVKGGDNDPAKIPGNRCVWDAGGEVVILDYVEGRSTTSIIQRMRGTG